jgi:DNA-directed RNA polymerase subunit RPC12/RpoP
MTGVTALDVILALVAGYFIWRVSMAVIRMLSTPPPEVNPDDVVAVDQDYKCTICGAELTMKAINVQDDAAPRHCREDMIPVWRPADL